MRIYSHLHYSKNPRGFRAFSEKSCQPGYILRLVQGSLYGRYHPTFADFQAAIQETIDGLPTEHAEQLKTLMTLKFQQFKDVSLMAA